MPTSNRCAVPSHCVIRAVLGLAAALVISTPARAAQAIAPIAEITQPASGATVSGTVMLEAAVRQDGVTGLSFEVDGEPVGSELAAAPFTFAWDTSSLSDGLHTVSAVVRDAAGQLTASAPVAVIVENGIMRLVPDDMTIGAKTSSYSTQTLVTLSAPDTAAANAIVMKFDLAGFPEGAIVQEAKLELTLLDRDEHAGSYTIEARKLTGAAMPLPNERTGRSYDRVVAGREGARTTWTLTTLVQEWISDPGGNSGLLLSADLAAFPGRYCVFASMEHPDTRLRPVLQIRYMR